MNTLPMIAVLAALVYLCRLGGFALQAAQTSPFWELFLRFVPISVFTTLVVSSLYQETGISGVKVMALGVAGLVVWRTRHVTLSMLVGFVVLWLTGGFR